MKKHTFLLASTLILLAVTTFQSLAQSTYEPYTFITLAGEAGRLGSTDGTGGAARFGAVASYFLEFWGPGGVAVDSAGNVYVADTRNNTIRKMTPAGVVTTLAGLAQTDTDGYPVSGSADGTGSAARFNNPYGVAVDSAGNVYVADTDNYTIRKVTPAGVVTTLAGQPGTFGSADGTGSAARFNHPTGIAADGAGNLYVADYGTIRKVAPVGVVTTLAGSAGNFGGADGTGSAAQFGEFYGGMLSSGVAVDNAGNIYVADTGNNTIRKVTSAGVVTTLAGLAGNWGSADGTGSDATFSWPSGVAVDSAGNVYVADTGNGTIRKVTPAGVVTTVADGTLGSADGTGSAARFGAYQSELGAGYDPVYSGPLGVAVDDAGNLYVADTGNDTIRKGFPAVGSPLILTQPQSQTVSATYGVTFSVFANGAPPLEYQWRKGGATLAGATNASYSIANVQAIDADVYSVVVSNLYGTATSTNAVLTFLSPYTFTTLAGLAGNYGSADGTGSAARFNNPSGVAVDSAGNVYVAADRTIRKVTPAGVVTTLAGSAGWNGSADGTGSAARFNNPYGVAVDSAGNVYVADTDNYTIRKVTPAGVVTTLAGQPGTFGSADGTGSAARFNHPTGIAADGAGNLYVADYGTIRKVAPVGVVTTLAGSAGNFGSMDGTGSAARFWGPSGVAVDSAGNVYVADSADSTIRKVTPAGVVTTLAGGTFGSADGTGSAVQFNYPSAVAVDSAGNVYVADTDNDTIRKVTPAAVVTTLAGLAGYGNWGSADGTGSAARFGAITAPPGAGSDHVFFGPGGVAVDDAGNLYVADTGNNTIRKGYPALTILNSGPGFGFSAGHFGFNLTGPAGQPLIVEASTDLVNWLPIWTNTSTLSFSDPQSGSFSRRFYRARTP